MTKSKGTETLSDAQLLSHLKEYLSYSPETGVFTRIKTASNNAKIGDIAGSKTEHGYFSIRFRKKPYYNHRLAWAFTHGYFPKNYIDHINGKKDDNRICNLREATNSQNQQNQRSLKNPFLGVSFYSRDSTYKAQIMINRKQIHIGYYKTPEEAHQAYVNAKRKLHEYGTM